MAKRGRPPKAPDAVQSERFALRLTALERQVLDAAASAAGLTMSEWVRRAAAYCVAARVPLRHVTAGPPPDVEVE